MSIAAGRWNIADAFRPSSAVTVTAIDGSAAAARMPGDERSYGNGNAYSGEEYNGVPAPTTAAAFMPTVISSVAAPLPPEPRKPSQSSSVAPTGHSGGSRRSSLVALPAFDADALPVLLRAQQGSSASVGGGGIGGRARHVIASSSYGSMAMALPPPEAIHTSGDRMMMMMAAPNLRGGGGGGGDEHRAVSSSFAFNPSTGSRSNSVGSGGGDAVNLSLELPSNHTGGAAAAAMKNSRRARAGRGQAKEIPVSTSLRRLSVGGSSSDGNNQGGFGDKSANTSDVASSAASYQQQPPPLQQRHQQQYFAQHYAADYHDRNHSHTDSTGNNNEEEDDDGATATTYQHDLSNDADAIADKMAQLLLAANTRRQCEQHGLFSPPPPPPPHSCDSSPSDAVANHHCREKEVFAIDETPRPLRSLFNDGAHRSSDKEEESWANQFESDNTKTNNINHSIMTPEHYFEGRGRRIGIICGAGGGGSAVKDGYFEPSPIAEVVEGSPDNNNNNGNDSSFFSNATTNGNISDVDRSATLSWAQMLQRSKEKKRAHETFTTTSGTAVTTSTAARRLWGNDNAEDAGGEKDKEGTVEEQHQQYRYDDYQPHQCQPSEHRAFESTVPFISAVNSGAEEEVGEEEKRIPPLSSPPPSSGYVKEAFEAEDSSSSRDVRNSRSTAAGAKRREAAEGDGRQGLMAAPRLISPPPPNSDDPSPTAANNDENANMKEGTRSIAASSSASTTQRSSTAAAPASLGAGDTDADGAERQRILDLLLSGVQKWGGGNNKDEKEENRKGENASSRNGSKNQILRHEPTPIVASATAPPPSLPATAPQRSLSPPPPPLPLPQRSNPLNYDSYEAEGEEDEGSEEQTLRGFRQQQQQPRKSPIRGVAVRPMDDAKKESSTPTAIEKKTRCVQDNATQPSQSRQEKEKEREEGVAGGGMDSDALIREGMTDYHSMHYPPNTSMVLDTHQHRVAADSTNSSSISHNNYYKRHEIIPPHDPTHLSNVGGAANASFASSAASSTSVAAAVGGGRVVANSNTVASLPLRSPSAATTANSSAVTIASTRDDINTFQYTATRDHKRRYADAPAPVLLVGVDVTVNTTSHRSDEDGDQHKAEGEGRQRKGGGSAADIVEALLQSEKASPPPTAAAPTTEANAYVTTQQKARAIMAQIQERQRQRQQDEEAAAAMAVGAPLPSLSKEAEGGAAAAVRASSSPSSFIDPYVTVPTSVPLRNLSPNPKSIRRSEGHHHHHQRGIGGHDYDRGEGYAARIAQRAAEDLPRPPQPSYGGGGGDGGNSNKATVASEIYPHSALLLRGNGLPSPNASASSAPPPPPLVQYGPPRVTETTRAMYEALFDAKTLEEYPADLMLWRMQSQRAGIDPYVCPQQSMERAREQRAAAVARVAASSAGPQSPFRQRQRSQGRASPLRPPPFPPSSSSESPLRKQLEASLAVVNRVVAKTSRRSSLILMGHMSATATNSKDGEDSMLYGDDKEDASALFLGDTSAIASRRSQHGLDDSEVFSSSEHYYAAAAAVNGNAAHTNTKNWRLAALTLNSEFLRAKLLGEGEERRAEEKDHPTLVPPSLDLVVATNTTTIPATIAQRRASITEVVKEIKSVFPEVVPKLSKPICEVIAVDADGVGGGGGAAAIAIPEEPRLSSNVPVTTHHVSRFEREGFWHRQHRSSASALLRKTQTTSDTSATPAATNVTAAAVAAAPSLSEASPAATVVTTMDSALPSLPIAAPSTTSPAAAAAAVVVDETAALLALIEARHANKERMARLLLHTHTHTLAGSSSGIMVGGLLHASDSSVTAPSGAPPPQEPLPSPSRSPRGGRGGSVVTDHNNVDGSVGGGHRASPFNSSFVSAPPPSTTVGGGEEANAQHHHNDTYTTNTNANARTNLAGAVMGLSASPSLSSATATTRQALFPLVLGASITATAAAVATGSPSSPLSSSSSPTRRQQHHANIHSKNSTTTTSPSQPLGGGGGLVIVSSEAIVEGGRIMGHGDASSPTRGMRTELLVGDGKLSPPRPRGQQGVTSSPSPSSPLHNPSTDEMPSPIKPVIPYVPQPSRSSEGGTTNTHTGAVISNNTTTTTNTAAAISSINDGYTAQGPFGYNDAMRYAEGRAPSAAGEVERYEGKADGSSSRASPLRAVAGGLHNDEGDFSRRHQQQQQRQQPSPSPPGLTGFPPSPYASADAFRAAKHLNTTLPPMPPPMTQQHEDGVSIEHSVKATGEGVSPTYSSVVAVPSSTSPSRPNHRGGSDYSSSMHAFSLGADPSALPIATPSASSLITAAVEGGGWERRSEQRQLSASPLLSSPIPSREAADATATVAAAEGYAAVLVPPSPSPSSPLGEDSASPLTTTSGGIVATRLSLLYPSSASRDRASAAPSIASSRMEAGRDSGIVSASAAAAANSASPILLAGTTANPTAHNHALTSSGGGRRTASPSSPSSSPSLLMHASLLAAVGNGYSGGGANSSNNRARTPLSSSLSSSARRAASPSASASALLLVAAAAADAALTPSASFPSAAAAAVDLYNELCRVPSPFVTRHPPSPSLREDCQQLDEKLEQCRAVRGYARGESGVAEAKEAAARRAAVEKLFTDIAKTERRAREAIEVSAFKDWRAMRTDFSTETIRCASVALLLSDAEFRKRIESQEEAERLLFSMHCKAVIAHTSALERLRKEIYYTQVDAEAGRARIETEEAKARSSAMRLVFEVLLDNAQHEEMRQRSAIVSASQTDFFKLADASTASFVAIQQAERVARQRLAFKGERSRLEEEEAFQRQRIADSSGLQFADILSQCVEGAFAVRRMVDEKARLMARHRGQREDVGLDEGSGRGVLVSKEAHERAALARLYVLSFDVCRIEAEEAAARRRIVAEQQNTFRNDLVQSEAKQREIALQAQKAREMRESIEKKLGDKRRRARKARPFIGFTLAERMVDGRLTPASALVKGASFHSSSLLLPSSPTSTTAASMASPPLVIDALTIGGPAYKKGLQLNDCVVSIAGEPATSLIAVRQIIAKKAIVGEAVEIVVRKHRSHVSNANDAADARRRSTFAAMDAAADGVSEVNSVAESMGGSFASMSLGGRGATDAVEGSGAVSANASFSTFNNNNNDAAGGGGANNNASFAESAASFALSAPTVVYVVDVMTADEEFRDLTDWFFDINAHKQITRATDPSVVLRSVCSFKAKQFAASNITGVAAVAAEITGLHQANTTGNLVFTSPPERRGSNSSWLNNNNGSANNSNSVSRTASNNGNMGGRARSNSDASSIVSSGSATPTTAAAGSKSHLQGNSTTRHAGRHASGTTPSGPANKNTTANSKSAVAPATPTTTMPSVRQLAIDNVGVFNSPEFGVFVREESGQSHLTGGEDCASPESVDLHPAPRPFAPVRTPAATSTAAANNVVKMGGGSTVRRRSSSVTFLEGSPPAAVARQLPTTTSVSPAARRVPSSSVLSPSAGSARRTSSLTK